MSGASKASLHRIYPSVKPFTSFSCTLNYLQINRSDTDKDLDLWLLINVWRVLYPTYMRYLAMDCLIQKVLIVFALSRFFTFCWSDLNWNMALWNSLYRTIINILQYTIYSNYPSRAFPCSILLHHPWRLVGL